MREALFWTHVEITPSCWLWTGATAKGYGRFWTGERDVQAHRWLYELVHGEVAPNLDLDHLCRVRNCVRPSHLEPVTRRENLLRGNTIVNRANDSHCTNGHAFDEKNTYYRKNGTRACRRCHADREAKRKAALRALASSR